MRGRAGQGHLPRRGSTGGLGRLPGRRGLAGGVDPSAAA